MCLMLCLLSMRRLLVFFGFGAALIVFGMVFSLQSMGGRVGSVVRDAAVVVGVLPEEFPDMETRYVSAFSDAGYYEKAFAKADNMPMVEMSAVVGGSVNHHLLADGYVANFFRHLSLAKPSVVVVVGPDHFGRAKAPVVTSYGIWETPFGDIVPDGVVSGLVESRKVVHDENPFAKEHAIFNLTGFLKYSLPEAKIVPLLIRQDAKSEDVDVVLRELKKRLPKDAVVVASVDFSHDLPKDIGQFHDAATMHALQSFNEELLENAEVDSPQSLRLMMLFAGESDSRKFHVLHHNDSSSFSSDRNATTSYVVGLYGDGVAQNEEYGSVALFGDISFSEEVCRQVQKNGLISQLGDVFEVARGSGFAGVRVRSVAEECDIFGAEDSLSVLGDTFLDFGMRVIDPVASTNMQIYRSGSMRVGVLTVYDDDDDGFVDVVADEVVSAKKKVDRLILAMRWMKEGEKPTAHQKEIAHAAIDAGADVVVGSGVGRGKLEMYRDRPIAYALGGMFEPSSIHFGILASFASDQVVLHVVPFRNSAHGVPDIIPYEERDTLEASLRNAIIILPYATQ